MERFEAIGLAVCNNFSCKHTIKVQSSHRSVYVIIEIFGDLASLMDVFGNSSNNEIHPRNSV